MPLGRKLYDAKGNLVVVTLFETYLAKFILEHDAYYKNAYMKLIDGIERYLNSHVFLAAMTRIDEKYSNARHLHALFSQMNISYPGIDSFETLKHDFNLPAVDFFTKLINDECFPSEPVVKKYERDLSGTVSLSPRFFTIDPAIVATKRSPLNPSRSPLLFSEDNRGVKEVSCEPEESTRALGIVSKTYTPDECKMYFKNPISPAGFLYDIDEESPVARWLMKRHMPVISGASGSTDALITRLFPLASITEDDKRMLIFAQSCNLVAHGHHSFGECVMVADHLGFKLTETTQLLDFYLQSVPESIRHDGDFQAFLHGELADLLEDIPLRSEKISPGL